MSGIKRLLGSSKFWTALASVAGVILIQALGMDEKTANAISMAIVTLGGLYIIATGVEDIGKPSPPAPAPPVAPEDATVDEE